MLLTVCNSRMRQAEDKQLKIAKLKKKGQDPWHLIISPVGLKSTYSSQQDSSQG